MYVTGPGHGGPGLVASTWLEGSYTEVYPDITRDGEGMRKLFRQFSFPGGIPSHVAPETPGSIHEGGELGYALVHAYGAAFDNPDLLRLLRGRRRRGRDRAARRELALEQVRQPGARRRGAAGAAPQRLQDRQPDRARAHPRGRAARAAGGLRARARASSPATTRTTVHQALAAELDGALDEIAEIQRRARDGRVARSGRAGRCSSCARRRAGPGPKEVDGKPAEGTWRSHQVPLSGLAEQPGAPAPARGVDALLQARGAVRRRRPAARRAARPGAGRRAPHGREPAHQRRRAAARPAAAGLPRLRGRRARPGAARRARRRACSATTCAT